MPPLYVLSDELATALRASEDGELPDDLAERLDGLQLSWEEKVENVCKVIRQFEIDAATVEQEESRLTFMRKRLKRKSDWLKDYLKAGMEKVGVQRVEGALFSPRIQKNSQPSVTVPDTDPPAEFARVKVEWDRNALIAAWAVGDKVPEGVVVSKGNHLRIG